MASRAARSTSVSSGSASAVPAPAAPSTEMVPLTPLAAATSSSWSMTERSCSWGTAPWNIGTGWPAMSATTVGTA